MQKLTQAIINTLSTQFSLGIPVGKAVLVAKGLNKVWRLTTSKGDFAIKCIDETHSMMLQHNLVSAEQSQHIAALMVSKRIPTIVALTHQNQYELIIDGQRFLVMPWVDGISLKVNQTSCEMTTQIGELLGIIHQAGIPNDELMPDWHGLAEPEWRALMNYKELRELLSHELTGLIAWSQWAATTMPLLQRNLVFSHRDLDAKNIIWQANQPILIDWEYAGNINIGLDLLIVGMNWSGVLDGIFDPQKCRTILNGYKKIRPIPLVNLTTLGAYYGYCLDWLIFNLRQFIRHKSVQYRREIKRSLIAMHLVDKRQADILQLFV